MKRHRAAYLRILAILAIITSAVLPGKAQNDPQYAQYWAIPTFYNPAYAGSLEFIRIRLGANLQWLGIKNAPRTFNGNADMQLKLGKKQRMGVGIIAMQERIGLFDNLMIGAQAAYQIRALKGVFSIGIQPAYYSVKFRGTDVYIPEGDDFHQPDDEALPKQDVSGGAFDLSVGVSYTHKYFSVGVSALHLLEPKVDLQQEGQSETEQAQFSTVIQRQLYFTADGNIPIRNSLFSLQPSLLVRTNFSNFSAEITMRATFKRLFWAGVGYRWKDALSVMAGAEFKNFFLGYAYSYPFSAINRASSGSHELVAGYMIKLNYGEKNKNKHRSIRIM